MSKFKINAWGETLTQVKKDVKSILDKSYKETGVKYIVSDIKPDRRTKSIAGLKNYTITLTRTRTLESIKAKASKRRKGK